MGRRPLAVERRLYIALAVLLAGLWLAGLGARPLFNPDEGRYAEIPREMLAGGDWVIPHLNGLAYAEKPPLQYWATALSYQIFGLNEFAARLYCALCALATIALAWAMARRLGGPRCAWRAAAMLGSMMMFSVLGHLVTLDMGLTFYLTARPDGLFVRAARCGTARSRAFLDAARMGGGRPRGDEQGHRGGGHPLGSPRGLYALDAGLFRVAAVTAAAGVIAVPMYRGAVALAGGGSGR